MPKGEYVTADHIAYLMMELAYKCCSQKDAAAKIGISPQYFCDIIKGKREVSQKVSQYFGFRRVCLFEKERGQPL